MSKREISTQTERGFLCQHFCGGTPATGGWEYRPTPVGYGTKTCGIWWSEGNHREIRGRGSQTTMKKMKKTKAIQTMDVPEEEKKKWDEELRRLQEKEEKKKQKQQNNYEASKEMDREKARSNRDRWRELMIRDRVRERSKRQARIRADMEELQRCVDRKEREFEREEARRELEGKDKMEVDEETEKVKEIEEEMMETEEEIRLLEEVLAEIAKENISRPTPPSGLKIVGDVVLPVAERLPLRPLNK